MKTIRIVLFFFILSLLFSISTNVDRIYAQTPASVESPEKHFGFKPGSDKMLFGYDALVGYLQKLDASSPRLKLLSIGNTPLGKEMYIAFISSEENIKNLNNLKEINRKLTLVPDIPTPERESMIRQGRVFVLASLSMHSSEVGPSQSAPDVAYALTTADDPQKLKWLQNVVYMMVPSHNPDGMDMIVNHYNKYKNTKYERTSMPGIYHKYVGHDNNRDFVTLSQKDTKVMARIYNKDWFPQVMVEKHQMGSTATRYFVPPPHDPIAENIDEGIWNWIGIFGSNLMKDMTNRGLAGISQHYHYDEYWPGAVTTGLWKNVVGFLTECASVHLASSVYIEPNELTVTGKGLSEYKKSINMPLPWLGGWWKLSDIVQYEITSTMSIIKTAALHREAILNSRSALCRKQVIAGKTKSPYYYIMPREQHDESELVALVNLLDEHGINIYRLSSPVILNSTAFKQGDIVVPLSQPFRPFIKEVMERQEYPVRHYTPEGEVIKPYDITSWSLPLHKGVKSFEINTRSDKLESSLEKLTAPFQLKNELKANFWAALFTVNNNESFKAAFRALSLGLKVARLKEITDFNGVKAPKGSFIVYNSPKVQQLIDEMTVSPQIIKEHIEIETEPVKMPKIALVETYFSDTDAGWTRFIFDSYSIQYKIIRPGDFEKTDFSSLFDVVIFPNVSESVLMEGKQKRNEKLVLSNLPPEYTKGIGKTGKERLMTFLDNGGIIISWGRSVNLFQGILEIKREGDKKEEFQLPFRDISGNLKKSGLYCPGSLVKMLLTEKFGFNPQFRASTPVSYKLLFNAVLLPELK